MEDDDGEEIIRIDPFHTTCIGDEEVTCTDATKAVLKFREEVINQNAPRQLFSVSRMEGIEELKRDIFVCYKGRRNNLMARPRVLFEGEEGAGSGPVREFLSCAIKIVDEGMKISSKPTIFFEGQTDHHLPIHDQALRITGSFKAIGRILGHCVLHNGPSLHGISPAIVHYLSNPSKDKDIDERPPPLSINDIPDTDLRECISQVCRAWGKIVFKGPCAHTPSPSSTIFFCDHDVVISLLPPHPPSTYVHDCKYCISSRTFPRLVPACINISPI